MKNYISLIAIFLFFATANYAQVAINNDGSDADASTILHLKSTDKGFLLPVMTEANKNDITNPAKGVLIFQSDGSFGMYYNAGTPSSPVWNQIATNPIVTLEDTDGDTKVQVEKTTDEDKIRFDIAGWEKMVIDGLGVGIGTTTPTAPLHVERDFTSTNTIEPIGMFCRTTSGTPANSIGVKMWTAIEGSGGIVNAFDSEITLSDVTSGSESSSVNYNMLSGGSTWNPISLDGENKRINLGGSGGNVGIGTTTATSAVHIVKSEGTYPVLKVEATGSDQAYAGYFSGQGPFCSGLYASSAQSNGLIGSTSGSTSRGVFGSASQISGENFGVYGRSYSSNGTGVYGYASRNIGANCGVHGKSVSFYGTGVKGEVTATTEVNYGGHFSSASTSGYGLYAEATAASGSTYGIHGRSNSTTGRGIDGYASASSGTTYGVYGKVESPDGYAAYFVGDAYVSGKLGLCSSSPDTKLDVNGVVTIQEVSSTPANPDADGETRIYIKDNKYIIQFNDGGTIKYRYMDLTSTDASWTYTTTAP